MIGPGQALGGIPRLGLAFDKKTGLAIFVLAEAKELEGVLTVRDPQ